jgi:hypothetical protein
VLVVRILRYGGVSEGERNDFIMVRGFIQLGIISLDPARAAVIRACNSQYVVRVREYWYSQYIVYVPLPSNRIVGHLDSLDYKLKKIARHSLGSLDLPGLSNIDSRPPSL